MLASASCVSADENWAFWTTRAIWSDVDFSDPGQVPKGLESSNGQSGEALAVFGALLVGVPLAIDLALLPITLPHDLFYLD